MKYTIKNVPNARVKALVRRLKERDGAISVDVKDNNDRTSDVTPTFPAVVAYPNPKK